MIIRGVEGCGMNEMGSQSSGMSSLCDVAGSSLNIWKLGNWKRAMIDSC